MALVVAKIARSDYPREWPALVSDLLGRAQGGSTLTVRNRRAPGACMPCGSPRRPHAGCGAACGGRGVRLRSQKPPAGRSRLMRGQAVKTHSALSFAVTNPPKVRRVYLVLHHVLKELSSKRLAADQRAFSEITSQLLDHVWAQWCGDLATILSGLPAALAAPAAPGAQPLLLHFERWLLLLKILRRLIVFGFPSDARAHAPVAAVSTCGPALLQAAGALAGARPPAGAPPSRVGAMVDRGVLKLLKTLAQVQEAHPWWAGVAQGAGRLGVGRGGAAPERAAAVAATCRCADTQTLTRAAQPPPPAGRSTTPASSCRPWTCASRAPRPTPQRAAAAAAAG